MYSDEDLNRAIDKGIFSSDSVNQFRKFISNEQDTTLVDEENFRLIGGFNDIFVVISCLLLLFSTQWVLADINQIAAFAIYSILAWGLAEFFVRKRRMALPAIVLLLAFVGGIFTFSMQLFSFLDKDIATIIATAISAVAAYLHWQRFKVPVTIAAGAAAIVGFVVSFIVSMIPALKDGLMIIIFICGISVFLYAMYWDAMDRGRTSRQSDVAFWLHLLSAPLIVHPVFSSLGILEGNESFLSMAAVLILYLVMTFISVAIDRRAFMVSSLVYVIYALSNIFKIYGMVGYSFAITGVLIGTALLLLSAYWHQSRMKILNILPRSVLQYLPAGK